MWGVACALSIVLRCHRTHALRQPAYFRHIQQANVIHEFNIYGHLFQVGKCKQVCACIPTKRFTVGGLEVAAASFSAPGIQSRDLKANRQPLLCPVKGTGAENALSVIKSKHEGAQRAAWRRADAFVQRQGYHSLRIPSAWQLPAHPVRLRWDRRW